MTDSLSAWPPTVRRDPSIDERRAVTTSATRLHVEFAKHFGVESVECHLHSTYDRFAGRAAIPHFLPLLAERRVRQRLLASARGEGKITVRPVVTTGWAQVWPMK